MTARHASPAATTRSGADLHRLTLDPRIPRSYDRKARDRTPRSSGLLGFLVARRERWTPHLRVYRRQPPSRVHRVLPRLGPRSHKAYSLYSCPASLGLYRGGAHALNRTIAIRKSAGMPPRRKIRTYTPSTTHSRAELGLFMARTLQPEPRDGPSAESLGSFRSSPEPSPPPHNASLSTTPTRSTPQSGEYRTNRRSAPRTPAGALRCSSCLGAADSRRLCLSACGQPTGLRA